LQKLNHSFATAFFLLFERDNSGAIYENNGWLLTVFKDSYSFSQTSCLRIERFENITNKVGIVFIVDDKNNSAESF
jgi:hypothetical protein